MAKRTHKIRKQLAASTGKFVSTRTQSRTAKQVSVNLAHNLRSTPTGCRSSDPAIKNLIHQDGRMSVFKHLESGLQRLKASLMRRVPGFVAQHKKLWNDTHDRTNMFNKSKKSFAETVIWFGGKDQGQELRSDSHVNQLFEQHGQRKAAEMLMDKARIHFENMADEFNLTLIGPTVMHMDEEGQPHFHQNHTNFDNKTGLAPGFEKNKNKSGEKLQDMIYETFKPLGFHRGISVADRAEIGASNRYQNVHDYSAAQDQTNQMAKQARQDRADVVKARNRIDTQIAKLRHETSDVGLAEKLLAPALVIQKTKKIKKLEQKQRSQDKTIAAHDDEIARLMTIIDADDATIRQMALDAKKVAAEQYKKGEEAGIARAKQAMTEHAVQPLQAQIATMKSDNLETKAQIEQMIKYYSQFDAMTPMVNHITKHYGKDQFLLDNVPTISDIDADLEKDLLTKMQALSDKLDTPFKA